jgi:hypothetical protein
MDINGYKRLKMDIPVSPCPALLAHHQEGEQTIATEESTLQGVDELTAASKAPARASIRYPPCSYGE